MFRIGILGSDGGAESGHAVAFARLFSSGNYDTQVVGIYGDNPEETKAIADAVGIPYIAEKPEDLLGKVDAVCVMPRDGNKHLEFAMPFAKAGVPLFIDKPFTCTVEDAVLLANTAKENGALLAGGTCVKFARVFDELKAAQNGRTILSGYVSFPITLDSEWGGMHFYSHHLIEEMLTLFGADVQSVSASRVGDNLVALAKYPEFPVIMNYASTYGGLHAGVYYHNGACEMREVDINDCYGLQCEAFVESLKSGKGDDPEYYVLAVKISNAICRAMEENKEIFLSDM